jgi:hypothetical protein
MKSDHKVTIEDDLWEKAVKAGDEMGKSVSSMCELGLMAVVDRKALASHIGDLCGILLKLYTQGGKKAVVK